MAQNEVKQSGRNYNEQEYSLRKNNAYRLDCHANRLARNDGTRFHLWSARGKDERKTAVNFRIK